MGFCGTGKWLKIKDKGKEDYRCPNCHRLQEDAAPLMVCPCANRTKLLHKCIDDLAEWIKLHHTEPVLAKVIGIYLRGQGKRRFRVPRLFYRLWDVATAQDRIGWRHFTEGKVCKQLRSYQGKHLPNRQNNLIIVS